MLKRIFDVVMAFIALCLLSPLLLLIGFLILVQDGHSPFFLQKRIGRNCQDFRMIKFRSMVKDADKKGAYFTSDGDPRITTFGRFIRRSSIDELPQLINVLIGDMSLVGPRPDVKAQEKLYTPAQWKKRHEVRPGLTGLAQVRRRHKSGHRHRLRLDLFYVDHPSFSFDVQIIFATVAQVIFKGGN